MKRVRMLSDTPVEGLQYKANQVVDFPNALGESLVKSGQADGSAEGIKYCIDELDAVPIVHENLADRANPQAIALLQGKVDAANAAVTAEKDAGRRAELREVAQAAEKELEEAKANSPTPVAQAQAALDAANAALAGSTDAAKRVVLRKNVEAAETALKESKAAEGKAPKTAKGK